MDTQQTYDLVTDRYGGLAKQRLTQEDQERNRKAALAFGYSPEELQAIPSEANLGVSCGNPLATAKLAKVAAAPFVVQGP